jgi:hypothetical protein
MSATDQVRAMPDGRVLDLASRDVADRLEIRADIRRGAAGRRSVEEGRPDRIALLLDEAAAEIRRLRTLAAVGHPIVGISVMRMTETCERTTYYVRLTTDEGFSTEPSSHRTGHAYVEDGVRVEVPGIAAAEALQRALWDAADWSDLLGLPVTPYEEDGRVVEPTMRPRNRFSMQRTMAARRRERERAAQDNRG